MKDAGEHIHSFVHYSAADGRISPAHVSLYLALFSIWWKNNSQNPITLLRNEIMQLAKISGRTTYQKCIQELHDYGYIQYEPSFNPFLGSLVYIAHFPECIATINITS